MSRNKSEADETSAARLINVAIPFASESRGTCVFKTEYLDFREFYSQNGVVSAETKERLVSGEFTKGSRGFSEINSKDSLVSLIYVSL